MKILHLEDNADDAELVRLLITPEWPGCQIDWVETRAEYETCLRQKQFDLIISDFALPSLDGYEALALAKHHTPQLPFIFLSGNAGEDLAIAALQAGADDYVLKGRIKRLAAAIRRAMREGEERSRRQDAERQMRKQAAILNQAAEAIFVTDLQNQISYWNAGAERLFGWRSEEIAGRAVDMLCDPGNPAAFRAGQEVVLQQGQWQGELRLLGRTGQLIFVESRQSILRDEGGVPTGRVWINTDLSERKRLEEQFLRSQRMENIGMLAAGIAHDLNNMLSPIMLAAPMLRDQVSDPASLNLLNTLERSAERGASLVRQILSFAQGASGEQRLVQVKHLLREICAVIGGTFPKSIHLEEFIPANLWPIKAQPTQVHQVLMNLAVNARDAMPEGGTLRIRAENCELDATKAAQIEGGRAGAFLVVQVEDTGTGIAPATLNKIWDPFFTTKEAGRGTGLGLSTVRAIVGQHNGFIALDTALGRGTRFRIYFPSAETGPAVAASPNLREIPPGNGELILVVDDERHIRDMTETMLKRSGYRVIVAADGVEAAGILSERAADIRLVISDLHMPRLDGARFGLLLRSINPGIKLLVVSGLTSALGHLPGFRPEEFADAFLHKPYKPRALLAKVVHLLRPGEFSGSGAPWPSAPAAKRAG